jgi:hypothetical protein
MDDPKVTPAPAAWRLRKAYEEASLARRAAHEDLRRRADELAAALESVAKHREILAILKAEAGRLLAEEDAAAEACIAAEAAERALMRARLLEEIGGAS